MSRKVIELIRVSTEKQADDDRASIPAQRSACRKIAERQGLEISWTIQIDGVSGASVMYSPEMKQLQQIVKSGECHGIVCKEHTRLMRPEDFGDYALLQVLKEARVMLYTPDGVIDVTTPNGQFLATVQFGLAGLERNIIRDRMVSSREQLRRDGRNASAPHTWPMGVAWDKERGWYWTADIEKVVRLFELFTSGITSYGELNRLTGISYYNIKYILKNPVYTGWRVYDTVRDGSASGKVMDGAGRLRYTRKVKRADEDIVRVQIFDKGIVSDATFARAQQMLRAKVEGYQRSCRDNDSRFIYRGLLNCAECGLRLYGNVVTGKRADGMQSFDYYVCRGHKGAAAKFSGNREVFEWAVKPQSCRAISMRRERLEPIIDAVLSDQLTDSRFLGDLLDQHEAAAKKTDNQARINRVRRELDTVSERRERLADLYIDGKLSKEQHAQRLIKLDQEQKAAHVALSALTKDAMPTGISAEELASLLAPFAEWNAMPKQEKRQLLSTVIPAIKVSNYVVHGVYLALTGEGPEDGAQCGQSKPAQTAGREQAQRNRTTATAHWNNENHPAMAHIIPMPVYLPLTIQR
jgi:DNA invertase Pin-like site-specific DNA recombinase